MAMFQQHWETRVPTSLFEQTQYEADQLFYATFPAARDAARNAEFRDPTQELSYPLLNFSYPSLQYSYSEGLHPQQSFQPSYYSPPHPIENEAPLYIPPKPLYHHQYSAEPSKPLYHQQYSSEPTSQYIPQSYPGPVSAREPVYHPSNISPRFNTNVQETVNDGRPESPRYNFRQLNRQMKPPTLRFSNNCQLGVLRLDRLSDRSDLDSPSQLHHQSSHRSPSPVTPPCPSTPLPTEFLLNLAPSPSIGLSSLPPKNTPEKKPPLACLFCRGRKIACGAPLPGSIKKTCNQCRKRGLTCYYPTESRRGMRKKKPPSDDAEGDAEVEKKSKKKKN